MTFASLRHWYLKGAAPLASTSKVALEPRTTVKFVGSATSSPNETSDAPGRTVVAEMATRIGPRW